MKKSKKNKKLRKEKAMYRIFISTTIFLIIGIIYSNALLGKINLEIQDLSDQISDKVNDNESLAMKINEMVSLDKIQRVSNEQGLTYNNDNIKSVLK